MDQFDNYIINVTGVGEIKAMSAALQESARASKEAVKELDQLEKGARSLTSPQGLLQLSYIFDDLANTTGGWERKLAAISNNLPGLFANIPMLAKFAGGFGLVGTAAIMAAPLVKTFIDSFSEAKLTDAEQGLDKLIKKAEEAARGYAALAAAPTDSAESRGAAAMKSALSGANAGKVAAGFAAGLEASGKGESMNSEELASLDRGVIRRSLAQDRIDAGIAPEVAMDAVSDDEVNTELERRRGNIRTRIKQANNAAGQALVDAMTKPNLEGVNARKRAAPLVNANPNAFPAGFLGAIEEANPENIRQQDELERQGRQNDDEATARKERLKAKHAREVKRDAERTAADVAQMDADEAAEARRQIVAEQIGREDQQINNVANRAEEIKQKAEDRAKAQAERRAVDDQLERNGADRLMNQLEGVFNGAMNEQQNGDVNGRMTQRWNALYERAKDLSLRASRGSSGADAMIDQRLARLEMMLQGGGNQGVNYPNQSMMGW